LSGTKIVSVGNRRRAVLQENLAAANAGRGWKLNSYAENPALFEKFYCASVKFE
jgi:hypothetical protein